MKKITTILVFVFAFTITSSAQQQNRGKLSVDVIMKKISSNLELTSEQQLQIKPIVEKEFKERKAMFEKRKEMRESGKRPTKAQRDKMHELRVAKEKEMDGKMNSILTEEQFTKYKQLQKEKRKKMNFTVEQRVAMAVKKMTLSLDLSESQQKKIRPLLMAQATTKKEAMEARKKAKQELKRPSSDEVYQMKMQRLDNRIAMKNSMKEILNKDQFEKFEKMPNPIFK